METISQQLLELRNQYAGQLAESEEQARKLQAKIADWRTKIAAIDTLTGGPQRESVADEDVAELEAGFDSSEGDGVFTPVRAYWRPILEVLIEMGGRGKRVPVSSAVEDKMKGILTAADYGKLPKSGRIRWRNRVMWQASEMRAQGLIKNNSPRGLWEISDAGRKWLDGNKA
jgi:hypothetical protein